MLQKERKIKSEKHRRFIASLECCVSVEKYQIQAAHIRTGTGGGMGLKPCDSWCIPLSVDEHHKQHQIGERQYWGDRLELVKTLAQFLWKHSGNREICLQAIKTFKEI